MPTVGIFCGAEELPPVDFDHCEPEVKLSEIQRIFIGKVGGAPFTDYSNASEWDERISETDTGINAIRVLTVIGDKPVPTTTKKDISGGRKIITRKDHLINATVDEVTEANHAFLQDVESGKRFKMWYETAGGFMFGGNSGIDIEISGDMVLARGSGEIQLYQYQITWASPVTESRILSPIFGQTVAGSTALDTQILFASDATPTRGSCDWILVGGTSALAKFQYNDINPTIGAALVMTVKVGGVLKLTANMTADFNSQPFIFTDIAGVAHSGIIAAGDVNF